MKMQPSLIACFFVLVSLLGSTVTTTAPQAAARSGFHFVLDQGWRFVKGDPAGAQETGFDASAWQVVTVPHCWNATDWNAENAGFYRGPGWYRRDLAVPGSWAGKRIFLRFGAAGVFADVFVNGQRVGEHKGAFAAFAFEITRQVKLGARNVLAVRVTNQKRDDMPPLSGDFNLFGGLYRPVTLFARDPVCITPLDYAGPGVAIRQVKVGDERADFQLTTKISNGTGASQAIEVAAHIADATGKTIASFTETATVPAGQTTAVEQAATLTKPHLWNGLRDPYLYSVSFEVRSRGMVLDAITQPLGVRFFRFDPAQGFFLNGRPYALRGVNKHQDFEGLAWATTEKEHDQDMALLLEIGANTVRLAHYQHSDYMYSLCDRRGLVVWAELPLVNAVNATEAFETNAQQQLRELIRQNINHPSILMWSVYNEVGLRTTIDPAPLVKKLHQLAKAEDFTRPTVAGSSTNDLDKFHESAASTDLLAANLYQGWYGGMLTDFGPSIDRYNRAYGGKGIGISEYGAGASVKQHEQGMTKAPAPGGRWHPEEWQAIAHEASYAAIVARPFVWGSFIWNLIDFSSAGRTEGDRDAVNDKGLVTYDRKTKKDAFYFYKANWTAEPVVYITSRRHVERTDPVTDVKVYSNATDLELKVNGKSCGRAAGSELRVFTWKGVQLTPGENVIEVEGRVAGKVVKDSCRWVHKGDPPRRASAARGAARRTAPGNTRK
jgi:beta-galactosidase